MMIGGLRRPKADKETYFTITSPLPDNHSKPSIGLFASKGRDGAAAKAASSLYTNHYNKRQKVFVLHMAKNARKDRQYPYLAVVKDVKKAVKMMNSVISISHERKVYSLCRAKVHPDVEAIMAGSRVDANNNPLPDVPSSVRDEVRRIVERTRAAKKKTTRATDAAPRKRSATKAQSQTRRRDVVQNPG